MCSDPAPAAGADGPTSPVDAVATDIGEIKGNISRIAGHLVPYLRANQRVGDLQATIDRLERQRAARQERPLISAVARALSQLRHLGLEPAYVAAVEGELVRALEAQGCTEFDPLGEPFDPIRHVATGSSTTNGVPVVTATHSRGVECYGDVVVRATVETGPAPVIA